MKLKEFVALIYLREIPGGPAGAAQTLMMDDNSVILLNGEENALVERIRDPKAVALTSSRSPEGRRPWRRPNASLRRRGRVLGNLGASERDELRELSVKALETTRSI